MIDTRQKLLDTAERLIGEQGYAATSMRQIIAAAGVNLAAIHYHFGSKEELLDGVIARHAGPVNERRFELLDRFEAEAGGNPPEVELVLEAFLRPMGEVGDGHPEFVRVMGRMMGEGMMPSIVKNHFQPVIERFVAALGKALPELPHDELAWRIQFMVGAMAHTMCSPNLPIVAPESDFKTRLARLVTFLTGGFHAPVTEEASKAAGQRVEVE
jgi:AcrR family transcriptional regulator